MYRPLYYGRVDAKIQRKGLIDIAASRPSGTEQSGISTVQRLEHRNQIKRYIDSAASRQSEFKQSGTSTVQRLGRR